MRPIGRSRNVVRMLAATLVPEHCSSGSGAPSEHSAAPGRFSNSSKAAPMEAEILASTILGAFEEARSQLIGKSAVLTDGKAGTVANVWLDELHGLRVSIKGHDGKWPVSTVKLAQS